jgi:cytochrome c biogenesis protein CcdA
MVFFNAAIVACVTIRMKGGDPSVSDGLRAAFARLPLIAGWALVQATVGLILRIIEDRSEMIGKIVAGLIGLAWTLTSFLVIPVLVVEEKGPLAALEESTTLLKKTWGEQLIGNFSFGLVFFALSIPAFVFIVLGFASGRTGMIVAVILAAAYLIGLGLIQSALQAIFQSALYMYVRNGQVPPGFQADLLDNAIMQK